VANVGQVVTGVVGLGVGILTGNPLLGLSLGLSLGGVLFPPDVETDEPKPAGLQFQTSQYGLPVKVLFGTRKFTGNMLWFDNFQKIKHEDPVDAGKGGSSQTTTSWTYTVSVAIGVCVGPANVLNIWDNNKIVQPGKYKVYTGAQTSADAHLASFVPRAPVYRNLCYVVFENYDLGSSAYIPNFTIEATSVPSVSDTSTAACAATNNVWDIVVDDDYVYVLDDEAGERQIKKFSKGRKVSLAEFTGSGLSDLAAYYNTGFKDCGQIDAQKDYRVQIDTKDGDITGYEYFSATATKVFSVNSLGYSDVGYPIVVTGSAYYSGTWTVTGYGTGYFIMNAVFVTDSGNDVGYWKKQYDTYKWSDTGGATWNKKLQSISAGSALGLESYYGQRPMVVFQYNEGHTVDDYWDFSTDNQPGEYVTSVVTSGGNATYNGIDIDNDYIYLIYTHSNVITCDVLRPRYGAFIASFKKGSGGYVSEIEIFGPMPVDYFYCPDSDGNYQDGAIQDSFSAIAMAVDDAYVYAGVTRYEEKYDKTSDSWSTTNKADYIYIYTKRAGKFIDRFQVADFSMLKDIDVNAGILYVSVYSGVDYAYSITAYTYTMGSWQLVPDFGIDITNGAGSISVTDLGIYTASDVWDAPYSYIYHFALNGVLISSYEFYVADDGYVRAITADSLGFYVGFDSAVQKAMFGYYTDGDGFETTPPSISEEILTNELYGLGLDSGYLDIQKFDYVKQYCVLHDMLVSMLFSQQMSVLDALQYIISHHDGFITYYDGKIAHNQMKAETSKGLLSTANNDFVQKKGSWPIHINQKGGRAYNNKILVQYTKRDKGYVTGTAVADDMVDIDEHGLKDTTVKLDGLTSFRRASVMANRLLQKQLLDPKSLSFKLGPKNIDLKPGEVWDITDSNLEIDAEQVRIMSVGEGPDYVMQISALEDKLFDDVAYGRDTTSSPILPFTYGAPGYILRILIVELPALYSGNVSQLAITYSRPDVDSWAGTSLYLAYTEGGSYARKDSKQASGITGVVLATGIDNYDNYIDVVLEYDDTLTSATSFDDLITVQKKNLIAVKASTGDVFVRFQSADLIATKTWRLYGLIYDIVNIPKWNTYGIIAVDDEVGFYENAPYTRTISDADSGRTFYYKLPSFNSKGEEQSLTNIIPVSEYIDGLDDIPLSPTNYKVNQVWVDDDDAITIAAGDIAIEWMSRNRYNTGGYIYDRTDVIVDDPDFKEFQIEFWKSTTLKRTVNQTAKSFIYTAAMQSADSIGNTITVKIKQISDLTESTYSEIIITTV